MMDAGPVRAVLTVLAGVVTGMLSAAFGVGGAVVSTPFIRVLGVSAAFAVGTTLPSVLPSAAAGALRYARESMVAWNVVAWTAPPGIVAAVAGSALSSRVPGEGHVIMLVTAGLLAAVAWRMATTDDDPEVADAADGEPAIGAAAPRPGVLVGIGGLAGLLSGLLGVGGGLVTVPGLHELGGLPLKRAIATSLACVGIFALPATLAHWAQGNIDWATAGWLSLGVVPGARIGAVLAMRAGDRRLRQSVAAFLGVVAVIYAVGEAVALLGR